MYYLLFYTFAFISAACSVYIVFSNGKTLNVLTIFILSVSGILALINAGFIAFILIFSSIIYYVLKTVKPGNNSEAQNNIAGISMSRLLSASVFGAVLASIAGSTFWQGKTFLHKEITASGMVDFAVNDYYVLLLLLFSAVPVLTLIFKNKTQQ